MRKRINYSGLRPLERSRMRLYAGRAYYKLSRYIMWYSGKYRFSKGRCPEPYPFLHFCHSTPLFRELQGVDPQYQYNKIVNLKLAVKKLDGIVIKPGETFSYWKLIGKPTARKGYVPGMVLYCGTYHMGMGGGLCQLSNLVYWVTLHTPLTVVERYRHSYDVFPDSGRTQPFGSGATCVYPYRDLMIRNETDMEFQLQVSVGEQNLTGAWHSDLPQRYRYEIIEKDHLFQGEYWGGFSRHNKLYRKRYTMEGEFEEEEYITENHALTMYPPFISGD